MVSIALTAATCAGERDAHGQRKPEAEEDI